MPYANYEELRKGVIEEYPRNTTDDRFMSGLNRVAPPGYEADPDTAKVYEERTDDEAAEKLVKRWGSSRLFRRK